MRDYAWMYEYCLNRFGSREALEARLPQPKSAAELRAVGDDRYLSLISLHHPDRGGSTARLQSINKAMEILQRYYSRP